MPQNLKSFSSQGKSTAVQPIVVLIMFQCAHRLRVYKIRKNRKAKEIDKHGQSQTITIKRVFQPFRHGRYFVKIQFIKICITHDHPSHFYDP